MRMNEQGKTYKYLNNDIRCYVEIATVHEHVGNISPDLLLVKRIKYQ